MNSQAQKDTRKVKLSGTRPKPAGNVLTLNFTLECAPVAHGSSTVFGKTEDRVQNSAGAPFKYIMATE
jgi:hypothetical protein